MRSNTLPSISTPPIGPSYTSMDTQTAEAAEEVLQRHTWRTALYTKLFSL